MLNIYPVTSLHFRTHMVNNEAEIFVRSLYRLTQQLASQSHNLYLIAD